MRAPIAEVRSVTDSPFIQDQSSLQNPLGVILTLAMVFAAASLLGAVFYFGF